MFDGLNQSRIQYCDIRSRAQCTGPPAVEQSGDHVERLCRPVIPLLWARQVEIAVVLLAEGRGDRIPGRTAIADVVERAEESGEVVRVMECRCHRCYQPDIRGDRAEGGEIHERFLGAESIAAS